MLAADALSMNRPLLWVGGKGGMEADLVKRANIPFDSIPAAGVHGVGWRLLPGNLVQLVRGLLASWQILRRFKPDVILFTGGFVAVPLALAARLPLGIKRPRSLVYIPDIEPGMALNVLVRLADQIAVTTEASRQYLPGRARVECTGYPVRPELAHWQRADARQSLGLQPDLPVLFVFGGSKGARSINRALLPALPDLLPEMQILHLSGQLDWPEVEARRAQLSPELAGRYHAYPYLHEEMGAALAAADLALSRAGASTLGEYPFFGLPAILVPYPYAWRYQHVNARYLVERGAALLVKDENLPGQLTTLVRDLLSDPLRLEKMSQAMRSIAKPAAAQKIASLLVELSDLSKQNLSKRGRSSW